MARNGTEQVRQLQRTLYRTAKQSKAVKFYSLYDKVWRIDVLWEAWKQVKENKGAPGVDGETIEPAGHVRSLDRQARRRWIPHPLYGAQRQPLPRCISSASRIASMFTEANVFDLLGKLPVW